MESINNDYRPSAFATKVMSSATSQRSLINTYKSCKRNKIITQELDIDSSKNTNYKAIMWISLYSNPLFFFLVKYVFLICKMGLGPALVPTGLKVFANVMVLNEVTLILIN